MSRSGVSGREGEAFHILFVCTGNTCRSPMAEALARRALADRGWEHVQVRSAGVAAGGAQPASPGALTVAEAEGLDLGSHRASTVTPELVEWADLILVMTPAHLPGLVAFGGMEKSAVITAFAEGREEEVGMAGGVRDPMGGSEEEYRATFRQLEGLVARVLDRLEPILSP